MLTADSVRYKERTAINVNKEPVTVQELRDFLERLLGSHQGKFEVTGLRETKSVQEYIDYFKNICMLGRGYINVCAHDGNIITHYFLDAANHIVHLN